MTFEIVTRPAICKVAFRLKGVQIFVRRFSIVFEVGKWNYAMLKYWETKSEAEECTKRGMGFNLWLPKPVAT
jgi:hypothetical protein